MVCKTCEKKLARVICPDKWKDGARNTLESGGRMLNENKMLSKKKSRFNPYSSKCQICKQTMHQEGIFCHSCAYAQGLCSMCGKQILDITPYAMSEGGTYHSAKKKKKKQEENREKEEEEEELVRDAEASLSMGAAEGADRQGDHQEGAHAKPTPSYQGAIDVKDTSKVNQAPPQSSSSSLYPSTATFQAASNGMTDSSGPSSAASAAVAMMAAFKGGKVRESFTQEAQQSPGWQFDRRSGYYFDRASGFYFDPKTRLYFDPRVQKWVQGQANPEASVATAAS